MVCPITQGDHNNVPSLDLSINSPWQTLAVVS